MKRRHLIIAAVIFWSSFGLLKESMGMSLAGVPAGIDLDEVEPAGAGRCGGGYKRVHEAK